MGEIWCQTGVVSKGQIRVKQGSTMVSEVVLDGGMVDNGSSTALVLTLV